MTTIGYVLDEFKLKKMLLTIATIDDGHQQKTYYYFQTIFKDTTYGSRKNEFSVSPNFAMCSFYFLSIIACFCN